jgi:hypothetical protein
MIWRVCLAGNGAHLQNLNFDQLSKDIDILKHLGKRRGEGCAPKQRFYLYNSLTSNRTAI